MQIRRGIKRVGTFIPAFTCLRAVQIRRGIKLLLLHIQKIERLRAVQIRRGIKQQFRTMSQYAV